MKRPFNLINVTLCNISISHTYSLTDNSIEIDLNCYGKTFLSVSFSFHTILFNIKHNLIIIIIMNSYIKKESI